MRRSPVLAFRELVTLKAAVATSSVLRVTPDPDHTDGEGGELVRAARAGDRRAFGRLFEEYASMVHGILLSRVPPVEADDLVQDVFLAALEKLSTLREAGAFGGWLAMIARNRAHD